MPEQRRPRLRIGELAARSGRSVHAIRWYEAQGLMPGVHRDAGGRRIYSERHVGWLELLDRLRCTGMSIKEMQHYTLLVQQGPATLEQRRQLLRAHRERVEQRIAEWSAALALIDRKLEFYDDWIEAGAMPASGWPSGRGG